MMKTVMVTSYCS